MAADDKLYLGVSGCWGSSEQLEGWGWKGYITKGDREGRALNEVVYKQKAMTGVPNTA